MATKKTAKKAPAKKASLPVTFNTEKGMVHAALAAIMSEVGVIGKDSQNKQQGFKYRGIEAAYNAVHPLLSNHHVITVPRVTGLISRITVPNKSNTGTVNYTMLAVEYDFVCTLDGSKVTVGPIYGEGMDSADKSTAKALAVAHKYAIFQTFCIPTSDMPDGDAETPDGVMPPASLMPQNPAAATIPQPALMPTNPAPQPTAAQPPPPQQPTAADVPVNMPAATAQAEPAPAPENDLVIEDEVSATTAADMMINLAGMHQDSVESLKDFWHKQQPILKLLNENFPSQYQRVAEVFAGYKDNLTEAPTGDQ